MGLKCGIVGLPNVGKSTLFNALTSSQTAEAANYPFCTIEPNSGIVNVPDKRLTKLAEIASSQKIIPAVIEFVDIAGLVSGASKGEGLGNQFLSHIREVNAIIHVVRCFENPDITHVHGKVDPIFDIEIIDTELILSDLESVEKRMHNLQKKVNSGDKASIEQLSILKEVYTTLAAGKPVRDIKSKIDEEELAKLQLITSKPVLYVANVLENEAISANQFSEKVALLAKEQGAEFVVISSRIEEEISQLESANDKEMFLNEIGLEETGLSKIIRQSYNLLGLCSYFTVGPKEARAWTFKRGISAPESAGIIHTDFEKGFIRAEVISYDDYVGLGGELKCKESGKMRLEGKEYIVKDGDVIHFRFNV